MTTQFTDEMYEELKEHFPESDHFVMAPDSGLIRIYQATFYYMDIKFLVEFSEKHNVVFFIGSDLLDGSRLKAVIHNVVF